MTMRTPLKRVRYLGSAKEGTGHFWQQRITAVANLFLAVFLIGLVVNLAGSDYAAVRQTLAHPIVAVLLLMLVSSVVVHMRLGMQAIIEDYVHSEGSKVVLILLNTFFALVIGAVCVFAVLKLSLGA